MRFSLGYLLLAFTATTLAAPAPDDAVIIPDPGTPRYECHAACGNVIKLSKGEKFCNRDDFSRDLKKCLNCAKKYDGWKYYGEKVSAAAETCDMDATPKEYSKDEMDDEKATVTTISKPSVVTTEVTVTATAESSAHHKSGLAKGAIAGIVISCVVGAAAIIAGTVFACKRRRNKSGASSKKAEEMGRGVQWTPETRTAEARV